MSDKAIIVSDESVNSYGFRLLNAGGDFTRFLKNPIGFLDHMHDTWDSEDYSGPIVKWRDLKIENTSITAIPDFDTKDPLGELVANKYENGFINTASIGFEAVEVSTDPKLMLPGQTGPTITKWNLIEISVTSIPSNENACKLYDNSGKAIELKDTNEYLVKLAGFTTAPPQTETNNLKTNMKKVTLKAGLVALAAFLGLSPDDAKIDTEVEFTAEKQTELNAKLAELETLKLGSSGLNTELQSAKDTIVSLTAKVLKLEAETAPPVGDPVVPVVTEGAPGTPVVNEFETETDLEMKRLKADLYPTA